MISSLDEALNEKGTTLKGSDNCFFKRANISNITLIAIVVSVI